MELRMEKYHEISNVVVAGGQMSLMVDGRPYTLTLADHSRRLAKADEAAQANFEISPSGYGIHWSTLDEELSVDGLIGVQHIPLEKER